MSPHVDPSAPWFRGHLAPRSPRQRPTGCSTMISFRRFAPLRCVRMLLPTLLVGPPKPTERSAHRQDPHPPPTASSVKAAPCELDLPRHLRQAPSRGVHFSPSNLLLLGGAQTLQSGVPPPGVVEALHKPFSSLSSTPSSPKPHLDAINNIAVSQQEESIVICRRLAPGTPGSPSIELTAGRPDRHSARSGLDYEKELRSVYCVCVQGRRRPSGVMSEVRKRRMEQATSR